MMERPLEIRQLDALKDWLREGSWTIREAACILVGVLPREREGDKERPFGAWLPGCEPWEEGRDSWANWIVQEIDHIKTVLRENRPRGVMGPKDYLSLAARLDISPPWLPAALADTGSRALLPADTLAGQPAPAGGAMTGKEVASMGGTAKRDKDPQRAKFFPIVQRMHRDGKNGAEIIRLLDAKYIDAPGDSTVYGWIKQIKAEPKTG